MIGIWQNAVSCSRAVCRVALLCTISYCAASGSQPGKPTLAQDSDGRLTHLAKKTTSSADSAGHRGEARVSELKFAHLTTNDGLSQGHVVAILQDRRGFMWIAPRDGLNRYDGNAFVVFKSSPDDPGSLNSNFIQDLFLDSRGYLWVATNTGENKFDPAIERCIRYIHEPRNSNSVGGASVKSVAEDSRGLSVVCHGRQRLGQARSNGRDVHTLSE